MKGSRSTCLLCRHLLATSGGLRSSQRHTQAALFSATPASKNDDPNAAASRTSTDPLPADPALRRSEPYTIRKTLHKEQVKTPKKQWPGHKPRQAPAKDSARIDALFQQIVREQTAAKDAPPNTAPINPILDLALVHAIGKLERMVEKGDSMVDAYAYLKSDIYPMLREPDVTIPRVFYRTFSRLMEAIVTAKKGAIRSPTLPTVAEIFRDYDHIGEMKPQRWAMLVGELVKSIVEMEPPTAEQESVTAEEALTSRDTMLLDLVESWKILSLPRVVPATPDNEVTDGFWFPLVDKASLKKFSDKGNFPAALSSLFPQYQPNQLSAPVAVLAIATYALLLDPKRSNPAARQAATRFIAKIADLIMEVINTFPALETYLRHKLESMAEQNAHTQTGESLSLPNSPTINAISIGGRLRQAFTLTRNIGEVDILWQKFIGSTKNIPPERVAELQKHAGLFDSFIQARMALNQPGKAIEALDTLRRVGLRPTLRTWNVMLDGCKKASNVNGIKNVWAKVAGSGMKLDVKIWTTRVSGLIESGDIQGGIQALQEMARLWKQSSKDEKTTAVKPTVEPVNAALGGLIRQNQVSVAESLLVWAGQQGIEPDVFTYNTLLRRFIRDGREKDVRRVFDVMAQKGVRANEATFTVVLDEAFSKIAPEDIEEQALTVTRVIGDMQAAGLEVNLQTYGKMIYNLLRLGDSARAAVKAVLAHLWAQGLELSPHIYTMIVEHYFARDTPDLDAVESLLQRRRLLDYDDMDATFYDRVIKGYALAGQPTRALEIYWRLSRAGVVVILSTQLELLELLVREDMVGEARALVANTKRMFEESHREVSAVEEAGEYALVEAKFTAPLVLKSNPS
ncbi:hypothetical protein GGR53DRAFT_522149 [Hypoxylon sp. FL1150]|nr:hypothetical protein GGR53DRAFT_522149 [Hypoxylon sp. FL1150]